VAQVLPNLRLSVGAGGFFITPKAGMRLRVNASSGREVTEGIFPPHFSHGQPASESAGLSKRLFSSSVSRNTSLSVVMAIFPSDASAAVV
jgi:hypothetical protein